MHLLNLINYINQQAEEGNILRMPKIILMYGGIAGEESESLSKEETKICQRNSIRLLDKNYNALEEVNKIFKELKSGRVEARKKLKLTGAKM